MAVETGTLTGAAIIGPTTSQEDTQGLRIGTLAAVVVIGPEAVGTPRTDLLALVSHLPISSIVQSGVTSQGAVAHPSQPVTEHTTGENTVVTQLTVTWSSGPTTEQLAAFNRTPLGSPIYEVTHA